MSLNSSPQRDRLSMLDEHGHRQFIIPAEVRGFFNDLKKKAHFVLLLIFLLLPWIHVNGKPLILFDIPARHFILMGLDLYAHDIPLAFLLIFIFLMGLALVTALWGRVWCGWACPQTVFIERVYRQIEIWVEGSYIQRRQLLNAPLTARKIYIKTSKWLLYFFVSAVISHSFIAYWTGSDELLRMMSQPPSENWSYFVLVMSITGALLFNFGWFREQFCLIMCPYGKFQSTLLDSHTVTVMYDEKRGEPRKSMAASTGTRGDCVSCNRCVQVCPTGIDIRNGIQMECIGCTACIDACDDIMTKVKKPQGLIRYKALTEKKIQWLRPRVLTYGSFLLVGVIALVWILLVHSNIRIEVLRAKDTPYEMRQIDGQEWVQNRFLIRVENEDVETQSIEVSSESSGKLILPENPLVLPAHSKKDIPLFVVMAPEDFDMIGKAEIQVVFRQGDRQVTRLVPLLAPLNMKGRR